MKMVTVELVKNFILLPAKNLEQPLTLDEGATVIPKFGIELNVISRGTWNDSRAIRFSRPFWCQANPLWAADDVGKKGINKR